MNLLPRLNHFNTRLNDLVGIGMFSYKSNIFFSNWHILVNWYAVLFSSLPITLLVSFHSLCCFSLDFLSKHMKHIHIVFRKMNNNSLLLRSYYYWLIPVCFMLLKPFNSHQQIDQYSKDESSGFSYCFEHYQIISCVWFPKIAHSDQNRTCQTICT